MHPVRPEEREEPPAGREVERDVEPVSVGAPAGRREFLRARHAAGGFEVEIAGADFNPGRVVLRIARDELALPAAAHRAEVLSLRRVEPPNLLHRARDAIAEGERAAIFIEPELARDGEARGLLIAHAAHPLLDTEG